MKKGIKQMGLDELGQTKAYLNIGYSIPSIAKKINRHKSTLYRMLKNNGIEYKKSRYRYIGGRGALYLSSDIEKSQDKRNYKYYGKRKIQFEPLTVHNKRKKRHSLASCRYCRIEKGSEIEKFVLDGVKAYWSPAQISGRWKLETNNTISKDTIYNYIYNNHKKLISKFFRRKGKKYQHNRKEKYNILNRVSIDLRPAIVETRTRIGDWEGDTIIGARDGSKQVILTNVERKTGYLLSDILINKKANKVVNGTMRMFKNIPKYKRITITYDNGREFSDYNKIVKLLGIDVYFAHAYRSRERGTNENTNGLIRQFFPKKQNFKNISKYKLKKITKLINDRPRERLGFLAPSEVF